MRTAARWILAARHRQVMLIAGLALLPALLIGSVSVAMASVLTHGFSHALPVLLASLGILTVAGLVSPGGSLALAGIALAGLVLAVCLAQLLRRSQSLTLSIQLALLAALAGIAVVYLQLDDVFAFWRAAFTELYAPLLEATFADPAIREGLLDQIAVVGTGMAAALVLYSIVMALCFGYALWDQGRDDAQARYGRFRDLNLGRALAGSLLVLASLAAATGSQGVLLNMALMLFVAFGLHGLALAHWARHRWSLPVAVLVVVYVLMLMPNALAGILFPLICVAGYVDAWFNFLRARDSAA